MYYEHEPNVSNLIQYLTKSICHIPADGSTLPHAVVWVHPGELGVVEVVPVLHVSPEVQGVVEGHLPHQADRAFVAPVEAVPPDPVLEPGAGGVHVHDYLLNS